VLRYAESFGSRGALPDCRRAGGASGREFIKDGLTVAGVGAVYGPPVALVVLGVLYRDWISAAIAGNMAGVPSRDVAIPYWLYFAFKWFPLFTF
jgi:hypothetical protein